MPSLKDLVNNLNNFKYYGGYGNFTANNVPYSKDRPGGGTSDQPYIVTKPGFNWSPGSLLSNVVPGGIIGSISHTAADVLRIGKFFGDGFKGKAFLAKQVGLQLMNPRPESLADKPTNKPTSGQGFFQNISNAAVNVANTIDNAIGTTRVYNPIGSNTLAQVGVSALGKHVVRHGFTPVMREQDKYYYIAKEKEKAGNNRLINLSSKFADQKTGKDGGIVIDSYVGGPGSFFGIGTTTIKSSGEITSLTGNASNSSLNPSKLNGFIPIGVDYLQKIDIFGKIPEQSNTSLDRDGNPIITVTSKGFDFRNGDFRAFKNSIKATGVSDLPTSKYADYNMPKRIGTINPSKHSLRGYKRDTDAVNMVSLYKASKPFSEAVRDINGNSLGTDANQLICDLVKFRIKVYDNDDPNFGVYLIFRAFFNGEITKDISAKWNSYNYVGRGESFYAYDGTVATLSFSFTIVAFSKAEMKPLYQKLNYLESSMYPDYKDNKMRGNFVELTIGDYIKYQPGIINNMSITIPEEANWEIAMDEPENGSDKNMHELPQMLRVNITFTPVYNFLPRKNSQTPFIGIDDTENGRGGPKDWLSTSVEQNNSKA